MGEGMVRTVRIIYSDLYFVCERSTWNRRLTLLVGSLATIPRESQNLLRTKSRSTSTASLRDNFSRAVTLNARIPRFWMEFQVLVKFPKEPEDPLAGIRRRRVVCRFRLPAGSFNFVFLPALYFFVSHHRARQTRKYQHRREIYDDVCGSLITRSR